MDVSCAILRGKRREVEEPLFFEWPSRGLLGIEKGALIEIVKGVFGLPDSPREWWKELCDTLPRRRGPHGRSERDSDINNRPIRSLVH